MSFVKIHGTILDSSIWSQPHTVRIVWITMLAMADANGVVQASVDGLARRAVVSVEECESALHSFLGPDRFSRDQTTGERISVVPGGWLILNHAQYRERRTDAQVKTAERVRKHREKHPRRVTGNDVTLGNETSLSEAEADAEADSEPDTENAPAARVSVKRPRGEPISKPEGVDAQAWSDWLRIRRAKHLALTQTAMKVLEREAGKAGKTVPEVVLICVERGWAGFQASWLLSGSAPGKPSKPVEHVRNMPLGTPSCGCEECVKVRARA